MDVRQWWPNMQLQEAVCTGILNQPRVYFRGKSARQTLNPATGNTARTSR